MQDKDKAAGWRRVPHDSEGTLLVRTSADGRKTYYAKFWVNGRQVEVNGQQVKVKGRQVKKALGPARKDGARSGDGLSLRQAKKAMSDLVATYKAPEPEPEAVETETRTVVDAAAAMMDHWRAEKLLHAVRLPPGSASARMV